MVTGNTNTPLNDQQKKDSHILAYAILIVWVAMQIASKFIYPELDLFGRADFLKWQAVSFALALVFGIINFENTFSTNDNWKTYGGIFSIATSVFLAWIFIKEGLEY